MNTIQLKSNKDLFEYLVVLSRELEQFNEVVVAKELFHASRFFSGSPTEFLHEAHTALLNAKKVCKEKSYIIQLANIETVIKQIDFAFKQVGGA